MRPHVSCPYCSAAVDFEPHRAGCQLEVRTRREFSWIRFWAAVIVVSFWASVFMWMRS